MAAVRPQVPFWQVSLPLQRSVSAEQLFPAQHGCPTAPHGWQVLAAPQMPMRHAVPVVQHAWVRSPHGSHFLLAAPHANPEEHALPAVQQSCPTAPHWPQVPF